MKARILNTHPLDYLGQTKGFRLYSSVEIEHIAYLWQDLQRVALHTPFQTYEWLRTVTLHPANSATSKPLFVIGIYQEEIAFLLPLATLRSSRGGRLTWIGNHLNDYNGPIVSDTAIDALTPDIAAQILELIAFKTPYIDSVELSNQPSVLGDKNNPFLLEGQPKGACSSYRLSLATPWSSFYRTLRSPKTRQRLKHKKRYLKRHGRVSFRSIKQCDEKAEIIQTIFRWKALQLLVRGDRNPFASSLDAQREPSQLQSVISQFLRDEDSRRLLRVYGLFVEGELISGMIAFTNRSCFSVFVNAYTPDRFANCSPGTLLLVKTMEAAARSGFSYYDFLSGDEAYKRDWSNETIPLHNCYIGLTKVGKLRAASKYATLSLKKTLKSSPVAMRILRSGNQYRNLPLRRQLP